MMQLRRGQRGFTLLELVIVVSIIGILAGTLLRRVNWYKDEAEMSSMETVVGVIRSALNMKVAQLIVQGRNSEISNLTTINPMDLLAQKPANYLGEDISPQKAKISPGNWYFNRKLLLLVYIADTGATFQGSDPPRFAYRIEVVKSMEGANGPNPAGTSTSTIEGVVLNRVSESAQ